MFCNFSPIAQHKHAQRNDMGPTILLIILVAVLLAVLPAWPYSRAWGVFPTGLVGVIIFLLLLLMFLGKL
jgi:hypothetical protein